MRHQITATRLVITAQALGFLIFLGGVLGDGRIDLADLRAIGLTLLVGSLMCLLAYRRRPTEQMIYEAGRSAGYGDGYDVGYHDGRRVAKPVVLTLPRGLAGDGTAHQLGQQCKITNATQRV